jgi:hypothetical protein
MTGVMMNRCCEAASQQTKGVEEEDVDRSKEEGQVSSRECRLFVRWGSPRFVAC